jgi:hypothetical protein
MIRMDRRGFLLGFNKERKFENEKREQI